MTTKRITRNQNIRTHLTTALEGHLHEDEKLETLASTNNMWMVMLQPLFQLAGLAPNAYVVVTNKRVLLIELNGKMPARDLSSVRPGKVIEQRNRKDGETFSFATTARDLHEPGKTVGAARITVEHTMVTPAMAWDLT